MLRPKTRDTNVIIRLDTYYCGNTDKRIEYALEAVEKIRQYASLHPEMKLKIEIRVR